jgi:hypothetical protein
METTDQAGNQSAPRVASRVQAFRLALAHEAVARGVERYTAKEFLAEFGEGQSEGHLHKSLRVPGWSQTMVRRIDAFIHRTLPDWTPSGAEADTEYTIWKGAQKSA